MLKKDLSVENLRPIAAATPVKVYNRICAGVIAKSGTDADRKYKDDVQKNIFIFLYVIEIKGKAAS